MTRCEYGQDDTDGVVVATNTVNEAQVTVHLDHLFFDTFAVDDANLRFDPMAAMAPQSGRLTLDDLAKQTNLSDLKAAEGEPLDVAYDPGSVFEPVPKTLEDYVVAAATTTGTGTATGTACTSANDTGNERQERRTHLRMQRSGPAHSSARAFGDGAWTLECSAS